ncbi:hypothetical protein PPSIR1_18457 [Plesiocystis pacifica SIR-1]|uniref:PilZ domain-containing protein n=1 Tax=Plesiocystis pacifica SIR-1 TaxID=391625 RepID=A6GCQ0_9BACT|nr:PilZ domain-containing protein [Plesiocystis pacifica]EDM76316.1 hypothetical protein PPSIR1_18457 [Plesiocystis pacifica SIR-1]
MSDRRHRNRVELRSIGTIDFGDRVVPCQVLDLSADGLAVVTPARALPLGPVRVRFQLGRRDAAWTEVDAVLRRRSAWAGVDSEAVWGLEILDMDLGTRTRVRDYLLQAA